MNKQSHNVTSDTINSILQGLVYLCREAEVAQLDSIRNSLITLIDDISGWVDNNKQNVGDVSPTAIITNSSFIAAIKFLSKFASIKDELLKKEIIEEIKKIEESSTKRGIYIFPQRPN
jgi:hypothetical protein